MGDGGWVLFRQSERELVLTLTENASNIVKMIVEQTQESADAGLRFSAEGAGDGALAVSPAPAAAPGDEVVERDGAKVFLEKTAAAVLDDKVLDARADESGSVEFSLAQQA
jgi:iron-sulfur cluster assembly protein